ncbi:MAG TPA: cytochrome B [Gammaproteobacteria bacterium]|nr:cytochrome B [Gammaproteobacteria bacterium]
MSTHNRMTKVWDPFVRIFHWTLLAAFIVAFSTEGDLQVLHNAAGYLMLGLLACRLVWGIVGTRHARFTDFITMPSTIVAYLKDARAGTAKRYLGHNPAGGAMIVILIIVLTLTVVTGIGMERGTLPANVASWFSMFDGYSNRSLKHFHEFFANLSMVFILGHVIGVLISSWQHRENLVRAMIDGKKRI